MYLTLCLPNQRGIPVSGPGRGQAVNFSDSCYKHSLSGGGGDLTPFSQREAGEQKDRACLSFYVILCLGKRRLEISACRARVDIFMVNQSRQSRVELLLVALKLQGDFSVRAELASLRSRRVDLVLCPISVPRASTV